MIDMDFRTALRSLEKSGEVNFEEFAEYLENHGYVNMPKYSSSKYLSKLFKMGLATRRKDHRYRYKHLIQKPYRYHVSKKGKQYLKWLKEELPKCKKEELFREADELIKSIRQP